MTIGPWGWIAVIIVCILIFTWILTQLGNTGYLPNGVFKDAYESMIVSAHRQYDTYFESPEHLYTKTIGHQNDETVQLALNKAKNKEKMHVSNEKRGVLSRKSANDAAINAFIIGDLYRYNIAPGIKNRKERTQVLSKAAEYYGKAVQRISLMPKSVVSGNTDMAHPPVEEMVNRVEDFYEHYLDQIQELGVQIPELGENEFRNARQGVRDARLAQAHENAQNPTTIPPTQSQRHGRKREPKKHDPNTSIKQIEQEEYFEERDIRSSPQNVHDTELTNEMLNIYQSIVNANNNEKESAGYNNYKEPKIEDIRQAIKDYEWSSSVEDPSGSKRRNRALKIVNIAAKGNTLSQLSNAREDDVLLNVWKRVNSPENDDNKDSLQESLMDSLANSMDTNWAGEYKEVCIGGRCARILGSLTLLDKEPAIAAPMKTGEILRNEVFSKSWRIVQDELSDQSQEIQDAYNGKTLNPSDDIQTQVDEFENNTKNKIEEIIKKDYSTSKPDVLDNLIEDAKAGV